VIVFEHKAFRGTSIADRSANIAYIFRFRAIHRHGHYGKVTDIRTESEHFDTIGAGGGIRFLQAGVKTLIAYLQAFAAGVDTSLILGH